MIEKKPTGGVNEVALLMLTVPVYWFLYCHRCQTIHRMRIHFRQAANRRIYQEVDLTHDYPHSAANSQEHEFSLFAKAHHFNPFQHNANSVPNRANKLARLAPIGDYQWFEISCSFVGKHGGGGRQQGVCHVRVVSASLTVHANMSIWNARNQAILGESMLDQK